MQKILIIGLILIVHTIGRTQKVQQVHSTIQQKKTTAHYEKQIELWKQKINAPSTSNKEWLNYFIAHQELFQRGRIDKEKLQAIQQQLNKAIPQTFEALYTAYLVNEEEQLLLKAYEKDSTRVETYAHLVANYYKKNEQGKAAAMCKKWLSAGAYHKDVLHWNYNALIGLAPKGILLTKGENYTFPLYLLQHGKQIRTDVLVLSMDWLVEEKSYLSAICSQLGIPMLGEGDEKEILTHLVKHINNRPLYVGVGISRETISGHEEELYMIGLAFQYSNQVVNNVALLKDNYENKFLLDYLKLSLDPNVDTEVSQQMNLKYLPAFLLLHEYYEEAENWEAANNIKQMSLEIAKAANEEKRLEQYWSGRITQTPYQVAIPYESIEQRMKQLKYHLNLYISDVEVTNADYELFLTDLLKKKSYEALQKYKVYKTDWRSWLPTEAQQLTDKTIYQHGHPNDGEHPVQNIDYASAVAYCQWLTKGYNSLEGKNKKYQKVLFRLPTEAEWEAAASTLSPYVIKNREAAVTKNNYTWEGNYYKNEKGCYLFNVNTVAEPPCLDCGDNKENAQDGAFFTTKVDAYFPSGYGTFNILGNVAEMVAEKGIAKGGSWFHTPQQSQIYSRNIYTQAQPYVGFRIVMEVQEYKNPQKKKKRGFTPPNGIHLSGNLYMDKTEITNTAWLEYQYWMKENDKDNMTQTKIDTNVWLAIDSNYTPFVQAYHNNPAYYDYPVVGVSYQQAQAYCTWRSRAVNVMLGLEGPAGVQVAYRLPTASEWEYAASGGLSARDFPYGIEVEKKNKRVKELFNYNYRAEGDPLITATAPELSYLPNNWGFYNFFGNVAEMVEEEGISKGGSWYHPMPTGSIQQSISYKSPEAWLGFRCICELR